MKQVLRASGSFCLIWRGPSALSGPNKRRAIIKHKGVTYVASHVSWALLNRAPFPKGKMALHRCDDHENPMCVYGGHLRPGDDAANREDQKVFCQTSKHPLFEIAQIIRTTARTYPEGKRYGVPSALHRYFHENNLVPPGSHLSRILVSRIVRDEALERIPYKLSAIIPPAVLDCFRGENADAKNRETKMPSGAAKLFKDIYLSGITDEQKKFLFGFGMEKYKIGYSSLRGIVRGKRKTDKSVGGGMPEKLLITMESLNILFYPYPALPGRKMPAERAPAMDVAPNDATEALG